VVCDHEKNLATSGFEIVAVCVGARLIRTRILFRVFERWRSAPYTMDSGKAVAHEPKICYGVSFFTSDKGFFSAGEGFCASLAVSSDFGVVTVSVGVEGDSFGLKPGLSDSI